MARKLIVAVPSLPEHHIKSIADAAKAHGFTAEFYESTQAALPSVSDAEIIFGMDALLTRNAPALSWFCTPQAGINTYTEKDAFASPHAILTHSSGAYGVTIAEHIVMLTLEMLRRRAEYAQFMARREWRRDLHIRSIYGSRVTLLGTGDIGQETAKRLRAFSPKRLFGINRSGRNPDGLFDEISTISHLDDVLPETDLLIMSLPGTKETVHILNEARLSLLPEDAMIVNVGRGNAIDQKALETALRGGKLGGAALDVFEKEPLPAEDSLWTCPHLIILPHIAGTMALDHTVDRIVEMFLEDFENYCAGRPLLHVANRELGY